MLFVLIVIGVCAGVYWYKRRQRRRKVANLMHEHKMRDQFERQSEMQEYGSRLVRRSLNIF